MKRKNLLTENYSIDRTTNALMNFAQLYFANVHNRRSVNAEEIETNTDEWKAFQPIEAVSGVPEPFQIYQKP